MKVESVETGAAERHMGARDARVLAYDQETINDLYRNGIIYTERVVKHAL